MFLQQINGSSGTRTPRAHLHSNAPSLSLNGTWRFRFLPAAPGTIGAPQGMLGGEGPEDFVAPDYTESASGHADGSDAVKHSSVEPAGRASAWADLPVPAHWVLHGQGAYGRPIYTNVQFPFPLDPPHLPDENPTGDYRRTFTLPADFAGHDEAILRFDGVESRFKVWLNGTEVGTGSGSRLATEFDVGHLLVEGENTIAIRVHQWSPDSYIEDQDQWWLPGIFRDVTLQARPAGAIDDVWLRAGFEPVTGADGWGAGEITPEIRASEAAYPLTLRVPELNIDLTWDSAAEVGPVAVPAVEPWSAEVPRLYEATISSPGETIAMKLGFRTVKIDGDQLLVNGRKVTFNGVNRHETHPDWGRVFNEEFVREDLALMKRHNINAIRTAHYPPHPRVLDIADEMGFWVILEGDLETHGFEPDNWRSNPSSDPAWAEVYLDRMIRAFERDKNHPSIIMWSLGNESGQGANLAAMATWLHQRDPERPVHYEGDYTGEYTDVYSRMYATIAETDAIGRDTEDPLFRADQGQAKQLRSKPFILCEYAHAMGNGPGGLQLYDDLAWKYPRLHGGFVWEWRDHGIRAWDADGTEFYAYGGDFGEVIHDSNFVMDGLVLSGSRVSPGLTEYAQVITPVKLTVETAPGSSTGQLHVFNRRHTADTSDLRFTWQLHVNGHEQASGELTGVIVGAGETAEYSLALPAEISDGEAWVTVEALLATDAPWAEAGHRVTFAQGALTPAPSAPLIPVNLGSAAGVSSTAGVGSAPEPSATTAARATSEMGVATFTGHNLTSLAGLPMSGPSLSLWRAPTDNDRLAGGPAYEIASPWINRGDGVPTPASIDSWREAGLDRLTARIMDVSQTDTAMQITTRWAPANSRAYVLGIETWWQDEDGLWLRLDFTPSPGWPVTWPRIGVRFDLPTSVTGAQWYGTGPGESYPDSRSSAQVGRFAARLEELTTSYSRPQESGHRSDLRELTLLTGDEPKLKIEAFADFQGRLPGFTLTPWTAEQLTEASHPHKLPEPTATYLYLDAGQGGLGSRSCGPGVWPDSILTPEARSITLRFTQG